MQQLFNVLALSVAIVSGTRTPEALVLTFGDTYLPHNFKASAISDNVVQRIIDLRMGSEVSLTLGGADQDTIEMLNDLGGTPAPLFGLESELDNPTRDLFILEGVDSKFASIIENEFQQNLLARVSSDDLLSHLSASTSPANEPGSLYTTQTRHCELHIGNGVPSDLQKAGKLCIPEGSVFEESPHILESALLGRASMMESWIDERTSATTLKISLQEHDSSNPTIELLQSVLRALDASWGNRLITAVFLPQRSAHREARALEPRAAGKKGTLPRTTLSTSDAIPQSNLLPVAPAMAIAIENPGHLTKPLPATAMPANVKKPYFGKTMFSAKLFNTFYTSVRPMIIERHQSKLQVIFRQHIQPWHPSSTLTHEAAAAVLRIAPDKFWDFSAALYQRQEEFFDVSVLRETRNVTYKKLSTIAGSVGVDENEVLGLLTIRETPATQGQLNVGNGVTNDIKLMIKSDRVVGVHVSPTVYFNGIEEPEISSSFTTAQWEQWLAKNII
ncbi:DsbA family protein [Aspergillus affinis]|uniref:DsbA family protein n=1 Tax=Aspergillus affinis TaxID=1070780 RepID=UPI0022FE5729|nr:uncharacterized protein KD926_000551 [Aspergillus affinis]KAI9044640.1 hypothetical protein KD926_000551 [Aspergillus affinis]